MHAFRIIQDFLRDQCPSMHAKRRDCLARMTEAAQLGGLGVVKMGKRLRADTALRHRIKCSDRLLSNPHLCDERVLVYRALAHRLLARQPRVGIVVDWSELREDGSFHLLRAAALVKGRAITLYEEVHPQSKLTSPVVHRSFMQTLKSVLPADCQPVIITDAGFRAPWFKMLNKLGWAWVGRIRNRDMICKVSEQTWAGCKTLYAQARTQARSLGNFLYVRSNPTSCRLVLMKSRAKGRHGVTKFGKPSRSKHTQRCRVAQSEPWLLAVSPSLDTMSAAQVVRLYAGRMQIEQTFRDLKNAQWGMGLRTCQTRTASRLASLALIGALLAYSLWVIGLAMRRAGCHVGYGSRAKAGSTLSILSLAMYWLDQPDPPAISRRQLREALAELISMVYHYEI